ncbi:MAG: hypothetical protein AAFN74_25070, partial [Myxococcota bacterium]
SPARTIRRVQRLAERARLKPTFASNDWFFDWIEEQIPGFRDFDLQRPLWVGFAWMHEHRSVTPSDVRIVGWSRTKTPNASSSIRHELRVAWPFSLRTKAGNQARKRLVRGASDDPSLALSALLKSELHELVQVDVMTGFDLRRLAALGEPWSRLRGLGGLRAQSVGLSLGPTVATLWGQAHGADGQPRRGADPNLNGLQPLDVELPSANYAFAYGAKERPGAFHAAHFPASLLASSIAAVSPTLRRRLMRTGSTYTQAKCRSVALGVTIPDAMHDAYGVARASCARPAVIDRAVAPMLRALASRDDVHPVFRGWRGRILRRSDGLSGGSVDGAYVLSRNAPADLWRGMMRSSSNVAVEGSGAGRAYIEQARAALLAPRFAEGVLRTDTAIAPLLPPPFSTVRRFLPDTPAVAYAAQVRPTGTIVWQLRLPNALTKWLSVMPISWPRGAQLHGAPR